MNKSPNFNNASQNFYFVRFPYFYFVFLFFLYVLSLPILISSCFRKKHNFSIPARFFNRQKPPTLSPQIWFHICSFGECRSIEPLISKLKGKHRILITTITQTGLLEAKRLYSDENIEIRFLPFELFLPFWRKYLRDLEVLVVSEAEIWNMLFFIAKSVGAKTMLINARITNHSYPKYKKMDFFYKSVFENVDIVLSQRDIDNRRLKSIGARNVETFGSLKVFSVPKVTKKYNKPESMVVLGASTHQKEEILILESFIGSGIDATLVLVPRHPERFGEVRHISSEACKKNNLRFGALSLGDSVEGSDVFVVDSLGELINFYAISDIVILGGSFVKVGGHNPLEPAFFGVKLLSGEFVYNQRALFDLVDGYKILKSSGLKEALKNHETLPNSSIVVDTKNSLDQLIDKILER